MGRSKALKVVPPIKHNRSLTEMTHQFRLFSDKLKLEPSYDLFLHHLSLAHGHYHQSPRDLINTFYQLLRDYDKTVENISLAHHEKHINDIIDYMCPRIENADLDSIATAASQGEAAGRGRVVRSS